MWNYIATSKKFPFLEEQIAFVVCGNWMTDSFGIRYNLQAQR